MLLFYLGYTFFFYIQKIAIIYLSLNLSITLSTEISVVTCSFRQEPLSCVSVIFYIFPDFFLARKIYLYILTEG